MARVRQARKCRAHRKDGQPCGSYAIEGGCVCRMHGGGSPRVMWAAYRRLAEADIYRSFEAESARYRKEWTAWQARRILVTAELLGVLAAEVRPVDIGFCSRWYGRPDGPETEPKMRRDHRFGTHRTAPDATGPRRRPHERATAT